MIFVIELIFLQTKYTAAYTCFLGGCKKKIFQKIQEESHELNVPKGL